MRGTAACDDCVVSFLLGREPDDAVVIDADEARAMRMLQRAGLVPTLRFSTRAGCRPQGGHRGRGAADGCPMKRHLLVTNDFPPKVGGIQAYLWELWRRMDPSTFAVLTASSHPGAAAFDAEQKGLGFRIERVPSPSCCCRRRPRRPSRPEHARRTRSIARRARPRPAAGARRAVARTSPTRWSSTVPR